jgi:hypothetical protein
MAKKVKTLTKLKKDLDSIFSKFIRLRNANDYGWVKCVTCIKMDHWKKLQAGHFISRRHLSTRWDEDNVQVQCYGCNVMQQGRQFEFSKWLDDKYGAGKSDQLLQKSRELKKFDRYELERLHLEYKQEVEYHLNRIGEL